MKKNHSKTKMTSAVFVISSFLVGLATVGVISRSGSGLTKVAIAKSALYDLATESVDPSQYSEISSAQLAPKIVSYTGTSLSRHLNVQFESQVLEAFAPSSKDVFYVVDDARYSGVKSDPFTEEVPDKTLNGFVYQAKAAANQASLYISNSISYGSRFTIKNTKVASNAMYQTVEYDVPSATNIVTYDAYRDLTAIYICDGIEEIASGAFVNVPATVTFKCVATSKPEGWADDWTDANPSQIEWGAELQDSSKASVKHSGSTTSFGDAEDFILGYKGKEDILFGSYPLTVSYVKTDAQGNQTTEYQTIPTKHQTNPYDAVGSKIYGKTSSFEITINLDKGETIDESSYEFYNVFKAQRYYIEEKEKWPEEEIKKVFANYAVPYHVGETETPFIPVLNGETFFHQAFETATDKYLTIAQEFETEEEANALCNQFKEKINAFEVSKDVYQTEEDMKYVHLPEYDDTKYGEVYKLLFKSGEVRTNIFVQFYTFHNDNIDKYEFVSYIILDNPVDEVDEEGKPTGNLLNSMSPFPISQKTTAVRPFIYVPEYEETKDDGGNVIARTPKNKLKVGAIVRFNKMTSVDELIKTKYKSSSKFGSYTSVGMVVDKVLGTAYAGYARDEDGIIDEKGQMKVFTLGEDGKYYNGASAFAAEDVKIVQPFNAPLLYINDNSSRTKVETNLNAILAGDIKFRYTFSSLNMASIIVVYNKNGQPVEKEIPISSPSPVIEINQEKNNVVSFLINNNKLEGVDSKDILAVGVSGMTVNIHLYNASSHNVVQNTQFINVFGNIEVLPNSGKSLKFFDINVYLLVFYLVLVVAYAALAVALFFYKKNKYKNDEFRRMKPKAYLKSALLGFFGLVLITAALNFTILRFAVFYSTVPTYNPIDAFVIAFVVFGAIALGFFIKNAVVAVKLMRKRRQALKLHLDKDVFDDGTK